LENYKGVAKIIKHIVRKSRVEGLIHIPRGDVPFDKGFIGHNRGAPGIAWIVDSLEAGLDP